MSDSTRARINNAFDEELSAAPPPPGLRALSMRAAVMSPRARSNQPLLLALVAAFAMVALVATLVVGSHVLRSTAPVRSRPAPSAVPPSPRSGAAMVYDGAHRELVLFGGTDVHGKARNETWTWDGKAWRLYPVAGAPATRSESAMAYDPARREVVLFGGAVVEGGAVYVGKGSQPESDDTWTWNGSTWKQLHPAHVPPLNFGWPASMAYDPASKTLVLYGFESITSGNQGSMVAETWAWSGSDWTRMASASGPSQAGTLVADRAHLFLIALSAGRVGGRYVYQTWRWDATTWTLLNPAGPAGGPAAFDAGRGSLVVFDLDTWTWDGSTWTRRHPTTWPPAPGYLAYFEPMHEVVMWGDMLATSNTLWAWDGADWHVLEGGTVPAPSPPGQVGPTTPAAAAAFIRQTVKTASPVLLPTWLPAGMEAAGLATSDNFIVGYRTDQRDKTIQLGIEVANPPPGDATSSDARVRFRNALALKYGVNGYAEYFVYDPSAPRSDRWLTWVEPGHGYGSDLSGPGVPYFLYASGLTDAEFWQVANSLR